MPFDVRDLVWTKHHPNGWYHQATIDMGSIQTTSQSDQRPSLRARHKGGISIIGRVIKNA
eukprot:3014224-Ditylum_brightwellii.AAC.1